MDNNLNPLFGHNKMKSPEPNSGILRHPDPQHFEAEYFRYLTPGSFTVLPPENCPAVPSPPRAPEPNKLTPTPRRRNNQAFAIIAEPNSVNSSRSASPTGRVSPFRGRGFNPAGSRHASPAPSPTPSDSSPEKLKSSSKSQIPKPIRRRSSAEDVLATSPRQKRIQLKSARVEINMQQTDNKSTVAMVHSKSMTNIAPRHLVSKPPTTPRRTALKPSFVRLSPIIGSSPDSADQVQVQSSPSKIPRSKSQPPSRRTSPSRNASKKNSTSTSQETSPTKIPMKTSAYKNIPAKIDSFNKAVSAFKPKVPQKPKVFATKTTRSSSKPVSKPQVITTQATPETEESKSIPTEKETKEEKESSLRPQSNKPSTSTTKNSSISLSAVASKLKRMDTKSSISKAKADTRPQSKLVGNSSISKDNKKQQEPGAKQQKTKTAVDVEDDTKDEDILSVTIDNFDGLSTTKVVTATTETVTKPLNIEAKLIKPSDVVNQSKSLVQQVEATLNSNVPLSSANPVNNQEIHNNQQEPNQDSINNYVTHTMNVLNSLESSKNSLKNLTPPDSDKVAKLLIDNAHLTSSANEKLRQARTVIVDEIRPIKITVREKSGDMEVQSGNFALPRSATNGITERPLLPPPNSQPNQEESPSEDEGTTKKKACSKLFRCCSKTKKKSSTEDNITNDSHVSENESEKPKFWSKLNCKKVKTCCNAGRCCKGNKVADSNKSGGCFPKCKRGKGNEENWAERRDSILSEPKTQESCCSCWRKLFCSPCCSKCRRKSIEVETVSRRTSMLSKKKSLSSTMQPPPEKKAVNAAPPDLTPKLDASLVEHTSHMRGAIPVLPVPLAWICLVCNVFVPGLGTILSGILCLCLGIPRFSPRDGARARIGAFVIDLLVGLSQAFTVLFCLVGWGWAVWWGVIMLKIAKKHRKIKRAEQSQIEAQIIPALSINRSSRTRDVEKGT